MTTTTTIGQQIYNGMGVAAWVLGFLFVLLGTVLALFLVAYGALLIAKSSKPKTAQPTAERGATRYAGGAGDRPEPYGHAPRAGRHVRKGP